MMNSESIYVGKDLNSLTTFTYWANCRICRDQFSLYIVDAEPDPVYDEGFTGRIEPSQDWYWSEGKPVHRCGGGLSIYGENIHIRYNSVSES